MRITIVTLNLNQKIGQLFIAEADSTKITGNMINLLKQHHIGGVSLSKNNAQKPQQLYKLTNSLQSYASVNVPLFIAAKQIDQQNCILTKGVSLIPSQKELGEINNRLYTKQAAEIIGQELYNLGINMNLAPDLEVSEDKHSSFSKHIRLVAHHGRAMMEGLHKQEVVAVAGTFPDPADIISENTLLYKTILEPYIYTIKHGLQVITINSLAAVPVLRNQLAFEGLIMFSPDTDLTPDEAIQIINGGADLILLKNDHPSSIKIVTAVTEAVKKDLIQTDKLNETVQRVITVKKSFKLLHDEQFNENSFQAKKHLNFIDKLEAML